MPKTMIGLPSENYVVGNNITYPADTTGVIANVADAHVPEMVRVHGCAVQLFATVAGNNQSLRTVSGTSDILLAEDNGGAVRYTSESAITITYPAGLGEGFNVLLIQRGVGAFTVQDDGTTTIMNRQSQFDSAGEGAECSLFADTADNAILAGDTA